MVCFQQQQWLLTWIAVFWGTIGGDGRLLAWGNFRVGDYPGATVFPDPRRLK
jgi:hypothetical protein